MCSSIVDLSIPRTGALRERQADRETDTDIDTERERETSHVCCLFRWIDGYHDAVGKEKAWRERPQRASNLGWTGLSLFRETSVDTGEGGEMTGKEADRQADEPFMLC